MPRNRPQEKSEVKNGPGRPLVLFYCLFLIGAIYPISFFCTNIDYFRPASILLTLLVSLLFTSLLYGISLVLTRHRFKALLLTLWVYLACWIFPFLVNQSFNLVPSLGRLNYLQRKDVVTFLLLVIILLCALLYRLSGKWMARPRARTLVIVFLHCLVLTPLLGLALRQVPFLFITNEVEQRLPGQDSPGKPKPDIYYIILDGYGRNDVFKKIYSFDNSGFTDLLKHKGFYVAKESHSNYPITALSITSSLNATHIPKLINVRKFWHSRNYAPLRQMLVKNRVAKTLKQLGYTYVAIDSNSWLTLISNADVFLSRGGAIFGNQSGFLLSVINDSPLPVFAYYYFETLTSHLMLQLQNMFSGEFHYANAVAKNIVFQFNTLRNLGTRHSPKFVFMHILAPHPPFLFSGDEPLDHFESKQWFEAIMIGDGETYTFGKKKRQAEYVEKYSQQVRYINRQVESLVEHILKDNPNSVIIFQGDHGPGAYFDSNQGKNTSLHERFPILNAYYFPDGDYSRLYPGITPVNSFRIVLNQFFGFRYPLLPDRSFMASWHRPYALQEVTELLQEKQE